MKHYFANRIFAPLLAICLILTLLPVGAWADSAAGSAYGIAESNIITITLSSGKFADIEAISHTYFSLGGADGYTISGIYRDSDKSVRLMLSANLSKSLGMTISADQDAFAEGTTPFSNLSVYIGTYAAGTATADSGTKDITLSLTNGTFSSSLNKHDLILGGSSAAGNPITAVAVDKDWETVTITLTKNIDAEDDFTVTARTSAFVNISFAPFVSPLPVTITPESNKTCAIGIIEYGTLTEALEEAKDGDTITLLQSITHTSPIVIDRLNITFNLGGYNLTIDTSEKNDSTALLVKDGSVVNYTGAGKFSVIGHTTAAHATGTDSELTVSYAETIRDGNAFCLKATKSGTVIVKGEVLTRGAAFGLLAESGGVIEVQGNVTCQGNNSLAVYCSGTDSSVQMTGDILAAANNSNGVRVENGGSVGVIGNITATHRGIHTIAGDFANTVKVTGNVSVNGSASAALFLDGSGTVTINGNVTAQGSSCTGVRSLGVTVVVSGNVDSASEGVTASGAADITVGKNVKTVVTGVTATGGSTVIIEGDMTSNIYYIVVGTTRKTASEDNKSSNKTGYLQYTDGVNNVYVKIAPATTPAEGNAWATLFTKSIFVRLSQGGFSAVQDKAYWTLGGDGASGNPIAGVTFIDNTEVQITLTHDINAIAQLTITADQDAFVTATTPFTAPLAVRLDQPQTYVCTIDGVAYPSLKSALQFALAPTVDKKTIVLAADIRYEERVVVEGKTLTFDLNGKNLVIDTSETVTGDWHTASALKADNGSVTYKGEGKFTVCGERCGVEAINGGKVQVSEILIKKPGRPYPGHYYVYGAQAQYANSGGEGSRITVTDGIKTLSGKPCDYAIGALAGQDSMVIVAGNIFIEGENVIGLSAGSMNDGNGTATAQNVTVRGEYATGVKAAGESTATVNGMVTATGYRAAGVHASIAENNSGGTVIVKGYNIVTGDESIGVACFSSISATAKSTVTVDGMVSGEDYLNIDNVSREKDAKDSVSGGYWIYNGQYGSVVKVNDPDGGDIPGGSVPTAPQSFTATPGNGRVILSWTDPINSGDSAVTGYQVSGDSGANWTNVGLTTFYEFTGLTNEMEYTFKVRAVNSDGNGEEASASAMPSDSAQTKFTVNFYSNGALYTSRSVINGSALGGSWPANPIRSGYTFSDWFNDQNGWGTRYTSSSIITSDVDLYANWSYKGGGSSSDNDSNPSAITPSASSGWLERSGTAAVIGNAKKYENGPAQAYTQSSGKYGVRGAAWSAFTGYQYWHATMDGNAVQVRVLIKNPAVLASDVLVSGYVKGLKVDSVKALFEKYFSNMVRVIHMDQTEPWGQTVEIAARVDLAGMDVTKLVFYSYDKATNTYRLIEKPAYWIDTNGYLHFVTDLAGDIIISERALTLKENGGAI